MTCNQSELADDVISSQDMKSQQGRAYLGASFEIAEFQKFFRKLKPAIYVMRRPR